MKIRSAPSSPVSHQVVELKPGRHASPEKGACVVELASMLAGERFSDHPRSVCPVIASYMRTVNDGLDEEGRQELYPYAAAIVGSRGPRQLSVRRGRLCLTWLRGLGGFSSPLGRLFVPWASNGEAALRCAKAALREGGAPLALTLADALIVEGTGAGSRDGGAVTPPATAAAA